MNWSSVINILVRKGQFLGLFDLKIGRLLAISFIYFKMQVLFFLNLFPEILSYFILNFDDYITSFLLLIICD